MKQPIYVTVQRADGTVEEGVLVGELRREGSLLMYEFVETVTLQKGDSLSIDGFMAHKEDIIT